LITKELKNRILSKEETLSKVKDSKEDLITEKELIESKLTNFENNENEAIKLKNEITIISKKINKLENNENELINEIKDLKSKINEDQSQNENEATQKNNKGKKTKRDIIKVDFEKYQKISNDIVKYLQKSSEINNFEGLKISEIIDYYIKNNLEKFEKDENNEDENYEDENYISKEIKLIKKIILRLINNDYVLIDTDFGNNDKDELEHIVVVNPNYFFE
jgi:hypothetical protein